VVELEDHRDVELALLEADHALVRLAVREAQVNPRVKLTEAPDRRGGERDGRGGERAQSQPAAHAAGDHLQIGLRLGEAIEHGLTMSDEGMRRVSEPHAARRALEQRHADVPRQRGHLLRHGRGRVAQRLRRSRQAAAGAHLAQDRQALEIEHRRRGDAGGRARSGQHGSLPAMLLVGRLGR